MFNPGLNFLVTAVDHRAFLRVAQVAASSFDHITGIWVGIATTWAFKAPVSWLKVAVITTLIAVVNGGVGPQIAHLVIGIAPDSF